MRENIRQKYGIEKPKDGKGKSSKKADQEALEASSILLKVLKIHGSFHALNFYAFRAVTDVYTGAKFWTVGINAHLL